MPRRSRTPRAPRPVNLDVQVAIVPRGMLTPRCGLTLLVTAEAAQALKLSNGEQRNAWLHVDEELWPVATRKNGAIVIAKDADAQR